MPGPSVHRYSRCRAAEQGELREATAGILLATGATLIVIVALLISGLRLMLPKLNDYRPQLLAQVEKLSGVPVQMDFLQGSWETFGPQLEVRNLSVTLPKSDVHIERVTLALDVWQSLLHWRWQFRDLTFYQFRLDLNATLGGDRQGEGLEPGKISDLMLRQLDHFDLRDSRISFLTPAGARAEFDIPQLTGSTAAIVTAPRGRSACRR